MIPAEAAAFFRSQLVAARLKALADAEDFQDILFAMERLGRFALGHQARGLGGYRRAFLRIVAGVEARADFDETAPVVVEASSLLAAVCEARNDALHVGAFARHLTRNATRLASIMEEALMKRVTEVRHFMAPNPVCGELWQPFSIIRHTMLANSFSFLPVLANDGRWNLLSDHAVAHFTRGPEREKRLNLSLGKAVEAGEIRLMPTVPIGPSTNIEEVLRGGHQEWPLLIADSTEAKRLLGILTSFDVL